MTTEKPKPTGLALLREPFPANQISKLPKATKRDAPKGKCKPKSEGGDAPDWQDHFCGGYHGLPAVHLDYVGHAALTDRLLDADPHWNWEPYVAPGLPNPGNGMWIKLNVCGQSQIGYGHADGKSGGDAIKEIIGDALRNAAMRFGAALDLWHKGDLHADEADEPKPENKPRQKPADLGGITGEQLDQIKGLLPLQKTASIIDIMRGYQEKAQKAGNAVPKDFDDLTQKQGDGLIKWLQQKIDEERIAANPQRDDELDDEVIV